MARVTQTTEYRPFLPPLRSRTTALAHGVLRGAVAAGLGFSSLAVLVMLLWISSPYPDSGPPGALHVTAALWLLAHGTALTRQSTLSGTSAPLDVAPMLLMLLPVWLIYRAARDALDPEERRPVATTRGAFSSVTCGYLLVTAVVLVYAAGGPMPAAPLSALVHLPLAIGGAAGIGVWQANGCPGDLLPRWMRAVKPRSTGAASDYPWVAAALRSGAAGAAALAGGGTLLVSGSLAWHAGAARASLMQLTGVWSGRFAVLLLAIALVPNAAVWAASYALGPGFALGAGATVTPLGMAGHPALPYFPLLAALPTQGHSTGLTWSIAAIPVAAGVVLGCFATRVPDGQRPPLLRHTIRTAATAAVTCAIMMAVLAALAGGSLGTGTLTSFGPVWWRTGAATLVWALGTGMPVALVRHWWSGRAARSARRATARAARAARTAKAAQAAQSVRAAGAAERERLAGSRRVKWWHRGARADGDAPSEVPGAPSAPLPPESPGAGTNDARAGTDEVSAGAQTRAAVAGHAGALGAALDGAAVKPGDRPADLGDAQAPMTQEGSAASARPAERGETDTEDRSGSRHHESD